MVNAAAVVWVLLPLPRSAAVDGRRRKMTDDADDEELAEPKGKLSTRFATNYYLDYYLPEWLLSTLPFCLYCLASSRPTGLCCVP